MAEVPDALLRAVYDRMIATRSAGYLSELHTSGDYANDPDATVEGSLKAIVGCVLDALAEKGTE